MTLGTRTYEPMVMEGYFVRTDSHELTRHRKSYTNAVRACQAVTRWSYRKQQRWAKESGGGMVATQPEAWIERDPEYRATLIRFFFRYAFVPEWQAGAITWIPKNYELPH